MMKFFPTLRISSTCDKTFNYIIASFDGTNPSINLYCLYNVALFRTYKFDEVDKMSFYSIDKFIREKREVH